jgi:DNA polymerase I-like protein with 3'-5' exonuclease and polymerase domains
MLKLLVEDDLRTYEDKDAGTDFGGKRGWWLKHNWLENAGVAGDEAKFGYSYPQLFGKFPKRSKKTKTPAPVAALGLWDTVESDVPLLCVADATARLRLGVESVANWHGHIDVRGGRVIGCTLSPASVMKNPNYLPLVIKETANLLEANQNRSFLDRPSVVKGIAPFIESAEAGVDLEWHYEKAVKAKKATKTKAAVEARPARSGAISVVGISYGGAKAYSTFDVDEGSANVRKILETGVRFIGHNIINADLPKLRELGIGEPLSYSPKHLIDTMIVAHLIHPHWSGMGLFGLEDLVRFYMPTTAWKQDKDDLLYYNGLDAAYNFRLWEFLKVDLSVTDQWHLVEKDQRLAQMAHLMRVRGIRVNSDALRSFKTQWTEDRRAIAAGFPFNPGSWQQVERYFTSNKLKFKGTSYDKLVMVFRGRCKYCQAQSRVGADGSLLLEEGFDESQLTPVQLMLLRLIQFKDEGKGVDTWFSPEVIENGRVHPKFNVTGTGVARFSSSDPNFQNVPPEYRPFILAQNDGEILASYDGKNIEGRTVARQANATQLLADYASGLDIHRLTASRILGKRMEDVSDDERQAGKRTVHATNYREKARSLAGRLYGNASDSSVRKATQLQDGYFEAHPEIQAWHEALEGQMSRGELQLRNGFGRVRMIYATDDHERTKRAAHFLGCSDGADVVNQRALDVWDELGLIPQMIVHDELLYSLPKGDVGEKLNGRIREILDSPIKQLDDFIIPFGYKHGENYGKYKPGRNDGGLVEED